MTDDLSAWRPLTERFRGRVFCGLFLGEDNERLALRPGTLARSGERGFSSIWGKPLTPVAIQGLRRLRSQTGSLVDAAEVLR